MYVLTDVTPTPEQRKIVVNNKPGVMVIRGSAGSGKTTTSLLRLRTMRSFLFGRKRRMGITDPLKVLVLTYNKTLRGYINALATTYHGPDTDTVVEISTFGKWARDAVGHKINLQPNQCGKKLRDLSSQFDMDLSFVINEVEYLLGRFLPKDLDMYLTQTRTGRGQSPRMDKSKREQLFEQVVHPYLNWKADSKVSDWNDLAVALAGEEDNEKYDIIITDETQDFSANQIRAITNSVAELHSLTFVVDAAQRIYARGFTWQEAGIAVTAENSHRLTVNYRNTREIARFALPLLEGLALGDDGTVPNFENCSREGNGELPKVIKGKFSQQTDFAINYIKTNVNLTSQTVGILHPKGDGVLERYIKPKFRQAGLPFVSIIKQDEWPDGPENIAFSTLHSAKGLEFDHVLILGLNEEFTPHGEGGEDDGLVSLRRLLAMGIGRAREQVIIGFKPGEESILTGFFQDGTYEEIKL